MILPHLAVPRDAAQYHYSWCHQCNKSAALLIEDQNFVTD